MLLVIGSLLIPAQWATNHDACNLTPGIQPLPFFVPDIELVMTFLFTGTSNGLSLTLVLWKETAYSENNMLLRHYYSAFSKSFNSLPRSQEYFSWSYWPWLTVVSWFND